jgi:hypothetical protein
MVKQLGFPFIESWQGERQQKYVSFRSPLPTNAAHSVAGYDYFIHYYLRVDDNAPEDITINGVPYKVALQKDPLVFALRNDSDGIASLPLGELFAQLKSHLPKEDLDGVPLIYSDKKVSLKLEIDEASGYLEEERFTPYHIGGLLYVRFK